MANDWDLSPPRASELGDREVPLDGSHLAGHRIALLVTGGIAAMKAPLVARALRRQGAEVVAFASAEALRYVTEDTLAWSTDRPVVTRLTPAAEHLSDDRPFAAYLVAPATYNTINKIRHGIADGVVTATVASALGRLAAGATRVLIAPTMHGSLHTPILVESLAALRDLGVDLIAPRDDYGKHNLPSEVELVVAVSRAVSRSPLKGKAILVTGGPTPVPVDNVRRITNRFRGRLGVLITEELLYRGVDVELVHGDGAYHPPEHVPHVVARTYDEYRETVIDRLAARPHVAGIFSAAVADYRPETVLPGKTPSGGALKEIRLVPLPKVVEEVATRFPEVHAVTFKYQEGVSYDELIAIARQRLALYPTVIANRGDEMGPADDQVAYLVTREAEPVRLSGKPAIARGIADHLEARLG